MVTPEQARDELAGVAAGFEASRDATATGSGHDESADGFDAAPVSWVSWQRPEDYYTEGH